MKHKKDGNKSFKDWTYEEVNNTFGLKRVRNLANLDKISEIKLPLDHSKRGTIEEYRLRLFDYIETWNEDEYKFFFISPFIGLVDFSSSYYKAFTQRPLSLRYENGTKTTDGLVEFMLAKGLQTPKSPHFFLHEYKPEKRRDNDPLGQLLIGMVAAKKLNQDDKPIYGIYLNGRNWFLVLLEDEQYAVSNPYVATSNDIFDLFAVLLFFKDEMEKLYQEI
jgi:hypothetical protein